MVTHQQHRGARGEATCECRRLRRCHGGFQSEHHARLSWRGSVTQAADSERRVPSSRVSASIGTTPVVLAKRHCSRSPAKEGTGERSETRGGRSTEPEVLADGGAAGHGLRGVSHSVQGACAAEPASPRSRGNSVANGLESVCTVVARAVTFTNDGARREIWKTTGAAYRACALDSRPGRAAGRDSSARSRHPERALAGG